MPGSLQIITHLFCHYKYEGWLMFYINTNINRIDTRVLTLEIIPQWVTLELGVTPPLLDKNNNYWCLTNTLTPDVYPFLYIAFGLTPSKECKSPEGTTLRDSLRNVGVTQQNTQNRGISFAIFYYFAIFYSHLKRPQKFYLNFSL